MNRKLLPIIAVATAFALNVSVASADDCLTSNAIGLLKIARDTVGLKNIMQLIGVTEGLAFLCPGQSENDREAAIEAAVRGLCNDWPCVSLTKRQKSVKE